MNIGDRIKKVRKSLDLTQEAFATRIGSVQNTITGYESGRRNPSAPVISLICKEFNVNEEWLRNGTGEMFNPEPCDELDSLADKFNLSHGEYIFLEKYLKLKREERDNVFDFIMDVCSAIGDSGVSETADAAPDSSIPDIDIDAEVEAYRQQLELQKKAAAESSLSNGGNEGGTDKKEA